MIIGRIVLIRQLLFAKIQQNVEILSGVENFNRRIFFAIGSTRPNTQRYGEKRQYQNKDFNIDSQVFRSDDDDFDDYDFSNDDDLFINPSARCVYLSLIWANIFLKLSFWKSWC